MSTVSHGTQPTEAKPLDEDTSPTLNVREAAALLQVSPWTVYKWIGDPQRRLPVKRAGSRVFFVRSELLDWAEGVR